MRGKRVSTIKNPSPLLFFLIMSLTTSLIFHVSAEDPDELVDFVGDKVMRFQSWCPEPDHSGLASICGTVVTSFVVEKPDGTQTSNHPVDNVTVAVYEENPISPTGKLEGKLTNLFSASTTNALGQFHVTMRRITPMKRVHLVFFCGGSAIAEHKVADSWHNWWNTTYQVNCAPSFNRSVDPLNPDAPYQIPQYAPPPFPLEYAQRSIFMGCTNDPVKDTPVGLEKKEQLTINNIVGERNYDHRWALNRVNIAFPQASEWFDFGIKTEFAFASPGGLWEPDCLLRNAYGQYQCNSGYSANGELACEVWERKGPNQPCSLDTGEIKNEDISGVNDPVFMKYAYGYGEGGDLFFNVPGVNGIRKLPKCVPKVQKVYGRFDCSGDAALPGYDAAACEAQKAEFEADTADGFINNLLFNNKDEVDAAFCDIAPDGVRMPPEDYATRPFFLSIPKGIGEASIPFRRWDFRNNLQNFLVDYMAPLQWQAKFVGSNAVAGTGTPNVSARPFGAELSTLPEVPSCDSLKMANMPFAERGKKVTYNFLMNTGPITALAAPFSTIENVYYSGQKDLSEPACQMANGDVIKLCEIQVPFGTGGLCRVGDPGCRDKELRSKLSRKGDPEIRAKILSECNGKKFVLPREYFPAYMIWKTGDTQMGMGTNVPNDSIPPTGVRLEKFIPIENEFIWQTGSHITFSKGGNAGMNSYNSVLCSVNPKWCLNDTKADDIDDVFTYPFMTTELFKKLYLDTSKWEMNDFGSTQTSMCSIGDVYSFKVTGPLQERNLDPSLSEELPEGDPDDPTDNIGLFEPDNLFIGNNAGNAAVRYAHNTSKSAGESGWYMSTQAFNSRDKVFAGNRPGKPLDNNFDWDKYPVRTTLRPLDAAFASYWSRDIWDSILIFMGGDAQLHDMVIDFDELLHGVFDTSLKKDVDVKAFGNTGDENIIQPLLKPYYDVTFEYPLTEANFQDKFKLPSKEDELVPDDWGPGHECYGFDTPVDEGAICGTTRLYPEGISPTCRVDRCEAFSRFETAKCTCRREQEDTNTLDPRYPGAYPPIYLKKTVINCELEDHDTRNLVIRDCTRLNRLECAIRQETSNPWDRVPDGYGNCRTELQYFNGIPKEVEICSPYDEDLRELEIIGDPLPPDDIDEDIRHEGDNYDEREHQDFYAPEHIEDSECHEGRFDWGPNSPDEQSTTISGGEGDIRPRCWASVAGPLRKDPNFMGGDPPSTQSDGQTGGTIQNCNGYIAIEDFASRMTQSKPTFAEQEQQNLDKATITGVKMYKPFTIPFQPTWGGNKLCSVDGRMSNNAIGAWDQSLSPDLYLQGQQMDCGMWGDVPSLVQGFVPEIFKNGGQKDTELRDMYYHCDMMGTYAPQTDREKIMFLQDYDPEIDGFPGWYCPVWPVPNPEITDISEGGACTSSMGTACGQAIATFKGAESAYQFSNSFKNAINFAAAQMEVPAAALLTVMTAEGGMEPQYQKFWEDDVKPFDWSVPWWGLMDLGGPATCNDLVWSAQGPFQILQSIANSLIEGSSTDANVQAASDKFCSVLNRAGAGRCRSASRCNLLDAAVMAAQILKDHSNGTTCGNFNMQSALSGYGGGSYENEGSDVGAFMGVYNACK